MTHLKHFSIIAALVAAVPAIASADLPRVGSVFFPTQYNMNNAAEGIDPNDHTGIFHRGWANAAVSLSGGFLEYDGTANNNAGEGVYWQAQGSNNWLTTVNATVGWTWETRLHVDSSVGDGSGRNVAFAVLLGDGGTLSYLNIGTSGVYFSSDTGTYTQVSSSDNTDGYHVFRIAKEGSVSAALSVVQIWRDEIQIGVNVPDTTPYGVVQWLGDGSGSFSGDVSIDYVRWTTAGAFAVPEPASVGLLLTGGAMMLRRRRVNA